MKKQFRTILSLFAFVALFTSCEDFLNEEPRSTWGVDDFYSSGIEADIALSGIYSYLASDAVYGQGLSVIMESGTDEGYYNRRYNENWTVGLYRHTPADNYVKNLWTGLYQAINHSNMFIEKLDKNAFETAEYDTYIAEARFLRAHAYSLLASWYEEVPMPLTSTLNQTSNHLALTQLPELYAQIISDFTFASEHLVLANDPTYVKGRANKMAAHGLLARVYLKMAGYPMNDATKFALAKEQCEIIINDPTNAHGLNTTGEDGYRAHFLSYIENIYDTKESIFEISFSYLRESGINTHGRIGGINGLAFGYGAGADGYPGAYAMFNTTSVLKEAYISNNDSIRKVWNLAEFAYSNGGDAFAVTNVLAGNYCPGKYRRWEPANFDDLAVKAPAGEIEPYILLEGNPTPNKNFTGVNFPVLRYADVLLMHAEADNEVNGGPSALAIQHLDEIRSRAGLVSILDPVDGRPSAVANKDTFFKELVDERLRELCFEGIRKHDLIRWGLLGEKLTLLNASIEGAPGYSPTNENHKSFLRAGLFFDPAKHLSLPYPLQEVEINNKLEQKANW